MRRWQGSKGFQSTLAVGLLLLAAMAATVPASAGHVQERYFTSACASPGFGDAALHSNHPLWGIGIGLSGACLTSAEFFGAGGIRLEVFEGDTEWSFSSWAYTSPLQSKARMIHVALDEAGNILAEGETCGGPESPLLIPAGAKSLWILADSYMCQEVTVEFPNGHWTHTGGAVPVSIISARIWGTSTHLPDDDCSWAYARTSAARATEIRVCDGVDPGPPGGGGIPPIPPVPTLPPVPGLPPMPTPPGLGGDEPGEHCVVTSSKDVCLWADPVPSDSGADVQVVGHWCDGVGVAWQVYGSDGWTCVQVINEGTLQPQAPGVDPGGGPTNVDVGECGWMLTGATLVVAGNGATVCGDVAFGSNGPEDLWLDLSPCSSAPGSVDPGVGAHGFYVVICVEVEPHTSSVSPSLTTPGIPQVDTTPCAPQAQDPTVTWMGKTIGFCFFFELNPGNGVPATTQNCKDGTGSKVHAAGTTWGACVE